MNIDFYNNLAIYTRKLLYSNKAVGLSFNEYDIMNDVYLEYPHLSDVNKIKGIILKKIYVEKLHSNILQGREFTQKLIEETKVCSKCHIDLPISLFGKISNMSSIGYFRAKCNPCRTKEYKERLEKNKRLEPINQWLEMLNSYKI